MQFTPTTMIAIAAFLAGSSALPSPAISEAEDFSYREGYSQTNFPHVFLNETEPSPVAQASKVVKRQAFNGPGYRQLYVCNSGDYGLNEGCWLKDIQVGWCYDVESCYQDRISSLALGQDLRCEFFENTACGGAVLNANIVGRGIARLWEYGFNDKITSWRCYAGSP